MKKIRRPIPPKKIGPKPSKEIVLKKTIEIDSGMHLEYILKMIPDGISYKDIYIICDGDEWSSGVHLEYSEKTEDPDYEEKLQKWKSLVTQYEKDLKIYEEKKALYDKWDSLSEGEKEAELKKIEKEKKQKEIKELERKINCLKRELE